MRMRWYDRDQTVSLAMSIIKNSSEKAQVDVARLIVKKLNDFGVSKKYTIFQRFEGFIKRWYDYNDELFESFEALKAAPKKVQKEIALEIIHFLHELEVNEAKKAKEAMAIEEISDVESEDDNGDNTAISDPQESSTTGITEQNMEQNAETDEETDAEKVT